MTTHRTDPAAAPVPVRTAVASIVGFWGFYWVMLTLRGVIRDDHPLFYVPPRSAMVLVNMGLSWAMYLVLRRAAQGSLRIRLGLAALLSIPASLTYAAWDHYVFAWWERHPAAAIGDARPGSVLAIGQPQGDDTMTLGEDLIDMGVDGFFFFVAWAVLYLQLATTAEVRMLERRSAELRTAAQEAELRALRYQVNPHFLYNTLNALSALVMGGRSEPAQQVIAKLAGFFRASLTSDPAQDVPLEDEFALQRLYLEIEEARFPDRLQVYFDLPVALATFPVPALIIQPLVENAVTHGVARTRSAVAIRIVACQSDAGIEVTVSNDLPTRAAESSPGTGVGLRNVADRLAIRYGNTARLITERADGRFVARLNLPPPAGAPAP